MESHKKRSDDMSYSLYQGIEYRRNSDGETWMELWGLSEDSKQWECLNEPAESALNCEFDEMQKTREENDQAWLSGWAETA
jgi:hypothetical protein